MANKFIRFDDSLTHYGVLGMKWGVRRYQKAIKKARKNPQKVKYQERAEEIKRQILSDSKIRNMIGADRFNNPKNIALAGAADFGLGFVLGYTGAAFTLGPVGTTAASVGVIATHASLAYGSVTSKDVETGRSWIKQNLDNPRVKQYRASDVQHSDVLSHFGVLGMKWGVRKDKETSGKVEGIANLITSVTSRNIGAEIGKLVRGTKEKNDDTNNTIHHLSELDRFDPSTETIFKAVKNVNEAYKFSNYGANKVTWTEGYMDFTNNCPSASMAYELRRRGYDCEAGITGGIAVEDLLELWNIDDKDVISSPPKSYGDMLGDLTEMGPGARGFCIMWWGQQNSDLSEGGGHVCSFEIDKTGRVVFIDAQSGKTSRDKNFKDGMNPAKYFENTSSYHVVRIDNRELNQTELAKWVRKDD